MADTSPQTQGDSRRNNPPAAYRFKPGQSGCPGGKRKGAKSIKGLLEKYGQLETPEDLLARIRKQFPRVKKCDLQEAVILRTYIDALQGDSSARQFIAERIEGKVQQPIRIDEYTDIRVGFED